MGKHSVWKVLNKESYSEDSQKEIEELYDLLKEIKEKVGLEKFYKFIYYQERPEMMFLLGVISMERMIIYE